MKSRAYLLSILCVAIFAACSNDEQQLTLHVSAFPTLNTETEYYGKPSDAAQWGDPDLTFAVLDYNKLHDESGLFEFDCYSVDWGFGDGTILGGGFAFSNLSGGTGFSNDYGYYAKAGHGKIGATYATMYLNYMYRYYNELDTDMGLYSDEVRFLDAQTGQPAAYQVHGFYVNNIAAVVDAIRTGSANGFEVDFRENDALILTIRNAEGTRSVTYALADYQDGKTFVNEDWEWVDLTSLGVTTGLRFDLATLHTEGQNVTIPTYFCIDGLTVAAL
ncbi:MAG: DUF4465 domain-containing protein [Prevotellaceae bacterium]|jgi:hypothetical protein|nr:DUF4465 domain-containing protein [Prevotellaceae bacterium]